MQWSRNLRKSINSGKAASICPLFYNLWYLSAKSYKYYKKIKLIIEFPAELAKYVFAIASIYIEPGFSYTESVYFRETLSRNRP